MPLRESLWKLRTDPFYPEVDAAGNPIPPEALNRSLNPLVDERVLKCYFDVYDWKQSPLVGELSPARVLARFPSTRTLPGNGLMLILSGLRDSGLDSLANLVLHKIQKDCGGQIPLVVNVDLKVRDLVQNSATIARRIINRVELSQPAIPGGEGIARKMEAQYDRVSKELRSTTVYSELFQTFRDLLEPVQRPVVIKIDSGGSHDNWAGLFDAVRSCAPYFIVITPYRALAKTCFDAMNANGVSVSWIQALPLGCAQAKQYLAARLAAERLGSAASANGGLSPFIADAIEGLYEPGATAGGSVPTYPIGWLRRMLYGALEDRLTEIEQQVGNLDPNALAALDPTPFYLTRDHLVRSVHKRQNGS
jgi:hypothetical protein